MGVLHTEKDGGGVVQHPLDQVGGQPALPGPVLVQLPRDVVELRVVHTDHSPQVGQVGLGDIGAAEILFGKCRKNSKRRFLL